MLNVNEGHDLRKSTRDLFEAGIPVLSLLKLLTYMWVHTHILPSPPPHTHLTLTVLSVFCPPLHSGEGKAEVSERQSNLRTNLDSFIENLMVILTSPLQYSHGTFFL